jgi:hypothetical protein
VFIEYHSCADNAETGGRDEDAINKKDGSHQANADNSHQSFSNGRYMTECYSGALQMHNNGGLTFVAESYFQVGLSPVKVVVNALTQQHMMRVIVGLRTDGANSITWTRGSDRRILSASSGESF